MAKNDCLSPGRGCLASRHVPPSSRKRVRHVAGNIDSIPVRSDDETPINVLYRFILYGGFGWVALIQSCGRGSFLEVLRAIPGFNTSRQSRGLLITETAAKHY